ATGESRPIACSPLVCTRRDQTNYAARSGRPADYKVRSCPCRAGTTSSHLRQSPPGSIHSGRGLSASPGRVWSYSVLLEFCPATIERKRFAPAPILLSTLARGFSRCTASLEAFPISPESSGQNQCDLPVARLGGNVSGPAFES